ncbi:NAD-P-binding protein [Stereum hirsutum FP-91666 SS1]|uniref:NAD-P-binding protein n=1 Tax=Stereum hirsutum (strain FP-91666) TaxID=721885 RepID=R7RZZ8_STEHR|nr:NAD-P-binding protein [Stereum hirsutum FP-91666 SS1]EIM79892.1 NAD-P-binding protein [Stereum hirsutum FP-91666 SS1]
MSTPTSTPIVLITGANRTDGIGYAAARQLALQHGFTVILGSRTLSPSLDEAVKQLENEGAKHGVHALQIDVASSESVKKAATEVAEKFGRLDVLVNNGALGLPPSRTDIIEAYPKKKLAPTEHTRKDFEEVFAVNTFGIVDTINAFAPLLAKSASPRIVNVSAGAGSLGCMSWYPTNTTGGTNIVYSASKAALNMLTVMYSKDLPKLNPSIKVNSGCPGYTNTSINKHISSVIVEAGERTPDVGAGVVVWLATLPDDGPNGKFYCDYPPYSQKIGDFKVIEW